MIFFQFKPRYIFHLNLFMIFFVSFLFCSSFFVSSCLLIFLFLFSFTLSFFDCFPFLLFFFGIYFIWKIRGCKLGVYNVRVLRVISRGVSHWALSKENTEDDLPFVWTPATGPTCGKEKAGKKLRRKGTRFLDWS